MNIMTLLYIMGHFTKNCNYSEKTHTTFISQSTAFHNYLSYKQQTAELIFECCAIKVY